MEDFMYQKFDGKKKERQTNYELLGQCMFDSGNDLGPGTAYGECHMPERLKAYLYYKG